MSEHQKALSVNDMSGFSGLIGCFAMVFGFVFSSMFFGMGSLFLWMIAIQPALQVRNAAAWVETPCTITQSEVKNNDTYSLEIRYEYEFNGKQLTGNRYNFFTISTGDRTSKERIVARYKEGAQKVCYVNPNHPKESVLNRSAGSSMWWGLFPLPFILVGLVGYWFVFFGRSNLNLMGKVAKMQQEAMTGQQRSEHSVRLSKTTTRVAGQLSMSDSNYDEEDLFEDPGPVTLEPNTSRFGLAIFLFIFATFWNGIISIFVYQRIGDWMQFKFAGLEDLFLVPFMLIGIGVLLAAIYCFMASFNPRPILILSRQLIPLGGSAQIQWSFEQGTGSIRQLQLVLSGAEEATYRRGTNTYTDAETFHEEVLA